MFVFTAYCLSSSENIHANVYLMSQFSLMYMVAWSVLKLLEGEGCCIYSIWLDCSVLP